MALKTYLNKWINQKIEFHLPRVFRNIQIAKLHTLKEMPNVSIADDLYVGDGCSFSIEEGANVLIQKKVAFRNYCSVLVHPAATLCILDGVFFNNFCSINCLGKTTIGDNTIFGEGVKMYDHNHENGFDGHGVLQIETKQFSIGSIRIGRNCWIGANVTILNNVDIGDNVIIGANCLIYKSIPDNSIVKHKEELSIQSNA